MKKWIILGTACLLVLVTWFIFFLMGISYNREEIQLRTAIEAKVEDNKNIHSTVWKTIKFHAKVPDRERDKAIELFTSWANERTPERQGSFMAWVKETAPQADNSLYKVMMSKIEGQLGEFKSNQTRLLHLSQQHNALIQDPWKKRFLDNTDKIDITIVISSSTRETFEAGVDDQEVPFGD